MDWERKDYSAIEEGEGVGYSNQRGEYGYKNGGTAIKEGGTVMKKGMYGYQKRVTRSGSLNNIIGED